MAGNHPQQEDTAQLMMRRRVAHVSREEESDYRVDAQFLLSQVKEGDRNGSNRSLRTPMIVRFALVVAFVCLCGLAAAGAAITTLSNNDKTKAVASAEATTRIRWMQRRHKVDTAAATATGIIDNDKADNAGATGIVAMPKAVVATPEPKTCHDVQNPKKGGPLEPKETNLTMVLSDIAIVRGGSASNPPIAEPYNDAVRFLLYVPSGFPEPDAPTQSRMRSVLVQNPFVDAVGGIIVNTKRDTMMITPARHCLNIELCHWTALLHFEYSCSNGPFMQCDVTSDVFLIRANHAELLNEAVGGMGEVLGPLSVFIRLKDMGAMVLTDVSLRIMNVGANDMDEDLGLLLRSSTEKQRESFLVAHAVDEIRNRDTNLIYRLCTKATCDAQTLKEVFGDGKGWGSRGISMPIFAYEAYVRAFMNALLFLHENDIVYHLYGGGELAMLKFGGRLLPWDTGDVDFLVDIGASNLDCRTWLAMLRSWADSNHYIHPHTSGLGGECKHYGAYAMPERQLDGRRTDVDDPISIGLVTFSNTNFTKEYGTAMEYAFAKTAYGEVSVRVRADQWSANHVKYGDTLLSHKDHEGRNQRCKAKPAHRHNCLIDTDGIHLDSCMEHTRLMQPIRSDEEKLLTSSWDRTLYEKLLHQRLGKKSD